MQLTLKIRPAAIALLAMLASAGCADEGFDAAGAGPDYYGEGGPQAGVDALYDHDVFAARDIYESRLRSNPADGNAAAGLAVTDVLLAPYWPETRSLLVDHLGARSGFDSERDVIYGDEGLLYLLSRGVPFDDNDSLAGIKTVLASDLPWSRDRLDSAERFFEGLSLPVDLMMDRLVDIAARLETVEERIQIAVKDPNFGSLFIPGATFHDENLGLTLGGAELSLLRAASSGVRAVILFTAAYENAWTLERAFGVVWQEVVDDPTHELHVEGWTLEDYQSDHLDRTVGRALRDADRLSRAGKAVETMFLSAADAIRFGLDSDSNTSLDWVRPDRSVAEDVITLLEALAETVDGPTALPFTEPETSVDLSVFFTDGKTLPAEIPWTEVTVFEDEFGSWTERTISEAAVEHLMQGVLEPPFDSEAGPELTIGEQLDVFVDDVSGEVFRDVEDAYATSL